MQSLMYNITGVTIVDFIFTLIVKGYAVYFLTIVLHKLTENYRKGEIPKLIINIIAGLLIICLIVGINHVFDWGKSFMEIFGAGSTGGTGTGAGNGSGTGTGPVIK